MLCCGPLDVGSFDFGSVNFGSANFGSANLGSAGFVSCDLVRSAALCCEDPRSLNASSGSCGNAAPAAKQPSAPTAIKAVLRRHRLSRSAGAGMDLLGRMNRLDEVSTCSRGASGSP